MSLRLLARPQDMDPVYQRLREVCEACNVVMREQNYSDEDAGEALDAFDNEITVARVEGLLDERDWILNELRLLRRIAEAAESIYEDRPQGDAYEAYSDRLVEALEAWKPTR